jgi:hypothetical protein
LQKKEIKLLSCQEFVGRHLTTFRHGWKMVVALDGRGGGFVQLAMLEGEIRIMAMLVVTTPSVLSLHMRGIIVAIEGQGG